MTIPVSLNTISNLQDTTTAQTNINANSAAITGGFSTALNVTGDQMKGNLDMNSNQILNLPSPAGANSPARLVDIISASTAIIVPPIGTSGAVVGLLNANLVFSGQVDFNDSVYPTASSVIASTIPSTVNSIRTIGYGTEGDGGAALYTRTATSNVGTITSSDGAFWQIAERILRPEMFSATADTNAIQTAINVANTLGLAGEVRLSAKNYRAVKQTGQAYCLNLYGNVSLIGEAPGLRDNTGGTAGTGSIISWGSLLNSVTDIVFWGGTDQNIDCAKITGIAFMPDGFTAENPTATLSSTLYGRDVIRINSGTNSNLTLCVIENNVIGPSNGLGINIVNPVQDFAGGVIRDNQLWGGIKAINLLDNCTIENNAIYALFNPGIELTHVAGSANTKIHHNNGIVVKEAVVLHNGINVKVFNNYFEVFTTFTGASGYVYYFIGDVGTLISLEFKSNIASQLGSYGLTGLVFIRNTTAADFDNLYLANSATSAIYGIFSDIETSNIYCGAVPILTGLFTTSATPRAAYWFQSASSSVPYNYPIPLTLQNSWTSQSSTSEMPIIRRERDGVCHVFGTVKSGAVSSGTVITTLPIIPSYIVNRVVSTGTGSIPIQIDQLGNFTWQGTAASSNQSIACTFESTVF